MQWQHNVAEEWLQARKLCITATELVSLLPEYKRQKKAGATKIAPAFAALWAAKTADEPVDTSSIGAAARGHIVEPYAVADYNFNTDSNYYHWDDCIIINDGVGFSPDALDVPQPLDTFKLNSDEIYPTSMLEIKSYGTDHHIKNMLLNKMELPERYQIAVAMIVSSSIKEGTLVFYCPPAKHSMYVRTYTRDELADDIKLLLDVLSMWKDTVDKMYEVPVTMQASFTEQQIIEEYIETLQGSTLTSL